MAPIDSRHTATESQSSRPLERAVGDHAIVWTQNPIILDDHFELEPDVALSSPRADFYKSSHPWPTDVLLAVEATKSSVRYDRQVKVPLFARHGIPDLWWIDVQSSRLTIVRRSANDAY